MNDPEEDNYVLGHYRSCRTPEEAEREIQKQAGRGDVWMCLFFFALVLLVIVYFDRNDLQHQLDDPAYRDEVKYKQAFP